MTRCVARVLHYAKKADGRSWSDDYTDITDVIDFQSSEGLKVKSDVFQLTITDDDNDTYQNLIGLDDRLDVFVGYFENDDDLVAIDPSNTSHFDKYFLFNGVINEWTYQTAKTGTKRYTIQGANVSEKLLRMLWSTAYLKTDTINTVPLIIQDLIDKVEAYNPTITINWDNDNPSVKSDGTAFPIIDWMNEYSPVYQQIEKISGEKYTEDGYYYFYMKVNSTGNHFVWRKRTQNTPNVTMVEGKDLYSIKVTKGVWDVVNYVVINAGVDPRGSAVQNYSFDARSMGQVGMRAKYLTSDISETIHKNEATNNIGSFSDDSRFPSAYPYVTSLTDTDGNSTTINSDAEYVSWFRIVARLLAKNQAEAVIKQQGKSRYKMIAPAVLGNKTYTLGQIYYIDVHSLNWSQNQPMRLTDAKHTIARDCWRTTYVFEQDWETVV